MTWGKRKPEVRGYYFMETDRGYIGVVLVDDDGFVFLSDESGGYVEELKNYRWAGPIPEPREA